MQPNAVIVLKSLNEYDQKIISKSGRIMDIYPTMKTLYQRMCHFGFTVIRYKITSCYKVTPCYN